MTDNEHLINNYENSSQISNNKISNKFIYIKLKNILTRKKKHTKTLDVT